MIEAVSNSPRTIIDNARDSETAALPNVVTEISLGEILQKKRQELKIEIEDAATFLRIKIGDIHAIENNEISRIAKHLYAPGLIRSYGKFLKIDERIIEEKIKTLAFKSNTENKKHLLINIGENIELSPDRDGLFNFLLISILLFLTLLSIYNSRENNNSLITNQELILQLKNIDS